MPKQNPKSNQKSIQNNVYEFYTPYVNQKSVKPYFAVGESMTQQHFAEETEINNILRSHDRNGIIEHINKGKAIYGDFSNITDFSDALEQINEAKKEFMTIPSEIREKFQNDAGQFFKFASNPDNLSELQTMGLANPQQSEAMPSDTAIQETADPKSEVPE